MSDDKNRPRGSSAGGSPPSVRDVAPPHGFVTLVEFRAVAVAQGLGYFREERFVIFGYCPGGGEVIWKDGHSSGFGTGGWQMFLDEIAPAAQRYGIRVGSAKGAGTHVLLIDRAADVVYAARREPAEAFLARINGVVPPTRQCICALFDCRFCPVHTCPLAGQATDAQQQSLQTEDALSRSCAGN